MTCVTCDNWVLKRRRLYDDVSEVVYFEATPGAGRCEILKIDTKAEFGCTAHVELSAERADHIVTEKINGAAWQHWKMGKCPDCRGIGSISTSWRPACERCVGTGNVRFYDDGYVGEERTRRHPKEPPPGKWEPEKIAPMPVKEAGMGGDIM